MQLGASFFGSEDLLFSRLPGAHVALTKLQAGSPVVLWEPANKTSRLALSVSADGRYVAIGAQHPGVPVSLLRETSSGVKPVTTLEPKSRVQLLRLSPTGDRLAVIENYNTFVELFDSDTGAIPVTLERKDVQRFWDLGWTGEKHPLGLVSTKVDRGMPGSEEWIFLWDTTTGKITQTATHSSAMNVLAVAPDGRRFAEAGADKKVRIRDTATLAVQQEFRAHDGPITALAWHPTRPILATASTDLCIRLWDLETGSRLEELRDFISPVNHLAFSPSGERLAGSNYDATQVWELPAPTNPPAVPVKPGD